MRPAVALLTLTLLMACGGAEEAPPPDQPAAAPAPAAPSLADFAGTWQGATVFEGRPDTVKSTISGSPDGGTWTLSLEGRPAIPMTASVVGDSLIAESVEYESILRPGVMVTVRTASALQDGRMVGTVRATYKTPQGEEVSNGTMTATRAP